MYSKSFHAYLFYIKRFRSGRAVELRINTFNHFVATAQQHWKNMSQLEIVGGDSGGRRVCRL